MIDVAKEVLAAEGRIRPYVRETPLKDKDRDAGRRLAGRHVVAVLCGANVALETLREVIAPRSRLNQIRSFPS